MADPGGTSAGEIGGIVAGALAGMATIGAAIRWLAGWKERRSHTLHAKLLAWEQKLGAREAAADADQEQRFRRLEGTVGRLQKEMGAVLSAYLHVADGLRHADPLNEALARADEILKTVFPLFPIVPADMIGSLQRIDEGAKP